MLPPSGNAVKLSKILIAHASNSVCFFHPLSLLVNNKIKKLETEKNEARKKLVDLIDANLKGDENGGSSITSPFFRDRETGKENFNKIGMDKYYDVKIKVLQSLFKDYLFQQYVEYKNDIYVLYFSMAGFDDTEWQILKWKKSLKDIFQLLKKLLNVIMVIMF